MLSKLRLQASISVKFKYHTSCRIAARLLSHVLQHRVPSCCALQNVNTAGLAIKDFWGVDGDTVVFVADPSLGNILNFNVGENVDLKVPKVLTIPLLMVFYA